MQKTTQINNLIQIIKRHRRRNQQYTNDSASPRNNTTTISNQTAYFKQNKKQKIANNLQLNSFRYIKDNHDQIHKIKMQIKTKSERKNKSQPKQRLSHLTINQLKVSQREQRNSCRIFGDTIKEESAQERQYRQQRENKNIKHFKDIYSLQDRIDEILGKSGERRYVSTDASPIRETSISRRNKNNCSFQTLDPNAPKYAKSKTQEINSLDMSSHRSKQPKNNDTGVSQAQFLKFAPRQSSPLSQICPSPGSPELSPQKSIHHKQSKFPKMLLKHKINKYTKYCQNIYERHTCNETEHNSINSPQKERLSQHQPSLIANPTKNKTKNMLKLIIYEDSLNNMNNSVAKSSHKKNKQYNIHSEEYKLYQMKYVDLNASTLSKNHQSSNALPLSHQQDQPQNENHNINKENHTSENKVENKAQQNKADENFDAKNEQITEKVSQEEVQVIKKYKINSQIIGEYNNNNMLNFKFRQKTIESPRLRYEKQQRMHSKINMKDEAQKKCKGNELVDGNGIINCKKIQIREENKSILSRNYYKNKIKYKYRTEQNNSIQSKQTQVGETENENSSTINNNTINNNTINNNNINNNSINSINNSNNNKQTKMNSSKEMKEMSRWSSIYEDEWRNMKIEGWQVKTNLNTNQQGL